jgi:hypothetical protein
MLISGQLGTKTLPLPSLLITLSLLVLKLSPTFHSLEHVAQEAKLEVYASSMQTQPRELNNAEEFGGRRSRQG